MLVVQEMIIGTAAIEFYIPQSHSLKDKRRVLKSIIARIRNKFNVSVSEIDSHELWARALIGIACISNDTKYTNQILSQIIKSKIGVRLPYKSQELF